VIAAVRQCLANRTVPPTVLLSLRNFLAFLLFLITTGSASLYFWQSSLLYIPSLPGLPKDRIISGAEVGWPDAETNIREAWIDVPAGDSSDATVKLHAWIIGDERGATVGRRPVLLWFHSNAGNISHRLPNVKKLLDEQLDALIVLISYRGYGLSHGTPSEDGLRADGVGSLAWLRSPTCPLAGHFDPARIFIFGRSLGTAVAIATVAAASDVSPPLAGLILENGFTSIDDMIDVLLVPYLPPLRYLKRLSVNKWPSLSVISRVSIPILFISSGRDEIVPKTHMDLLYEAAATSAPNRVFVRFPTATHMDAYTFPGYTEQLRSFMARPFFRGGKYTI